MIEEKANEMFKKGQVINNKGQIKDQEKFNQALFALMEERFQGGMEIQANSFKGLKSTISGIWKTGLASIAGISNTGEIVAGGLFDRLKDGLKTVADWMQKLADNNAFEKLGVKLGGLIDKAKDGGKKLLDFFGPTFQAIRDAAGKVTDKFNEVKDSIFDMASSVQDKGKSALEMCIRDRQKDMSGQENLNISPRYLIVPVALQMKMCIRDSLRYSSYKRLTDYNWQVW